MVKYQIEARRDGTGKLVYLMLKPPRGKKVELKFDYSWEDSCLREVEVKGGIEDLPTSSEMMRMILSSATLAPSLIVAKPEWYDRNAINQTKKYIAVNVAPHGTTIRWTYTVPNYKKAWLDFIWFSIRRRTAATALIDYGGNVVYLFYTPKGGTGKVMFNIVLNDNTVDKEWKETISSNIALFEGDKIELITINEDTGGAMDYDVFAKITEFDA